MRRSRIWKISAQDLCSSLVGTALLIGLAATSAVAARPVKYVHFGPAGSQCLKGQPLPCEPYQGLGESNVLEVHQAKLSQQMRFHTLEVPGIPDDFLWVAAHFGGECRHAWSPMAPIITLYDITTYTMRDAPLAYEAGTWQGWPIEHSFGEEKIWDHVVNMWIPFDEVFAVQDEEWMYGDHVKGFPTVQSIRDYGESVIKDRMDDGWTEKQARSVGFEYETRIPMHGRLGCRKNSNVNRKQWRYQGNDIPFTIKYVGDPTMAQQVLGHDRPDVGSEDLTVETAILQAHLSVMLDPQDSCRLALSGVIVTNEPTEVKYRIVDEVGLESNIFTVHVGETLSVLLDNYVELPVIYPGVSGGLGGLVAEDDGEMGGFVHEESDNEQGTFMIEILEPHAYESNIAGFNVEPCYGTLNPGGGRLIDPGIRPVVEPPAPQRWGNGPTTLRR